MRWCSIRGPKHANCKKWVWLGLHIVQKTPIRPQWVWSSFEHIDNVPEPGTTPSIGRRFSFNDPSRPQVLDPSTAPPPISNRNPPLDNPRAMQVIRSKKIADSTRKTNDDYRALLRGHGVGKLSVGHDSVAEISTARRGKWRAVSRSIHGS